MPFSVSQRRRVRPAVAVAASVLFALLASAQQPPALTPEVRQAIDDAALQVLARAGVPSASLAVVKDGRIAYLRAYGDARLDPRNPATPAMRYSIGSISKQFTAVAMLLLQQDGKLSLDDKVGKYLPDLTRANEVSLRQLLSQTSGYRDYWPQDYVPPAMLQPINTRQILDSWARKPLDFDPGAQWQYSNTNYVIAGLIVEKVSGMPLLQLLQQRVFGPLGMNSVTNTDERKLEAPDPVGYMRFGLGPLRPAPLEASGWMFAAGELAMSAEDLAKWDVALIRRQIMTKASYRELESEVLLNNGLGTRYGLGLDVESERGHRLLSHSGEVGGFTAQNSVYPDNGVAIVVLTNQDAASAAQQLAQRIAPLLLPAAADPAAPEKLERARAIFAGLQKGELDRSLFTANANAYFSELALKDFAGGLAPLGTPQEFVQTRQTPRGGMTLRVYRVKFPNRTLRVWTYEMPDGRLEQYQVAAVE